MIKISGNLYGIKQNVYYRWYPAGQETMYSIYFNKQEIKLKKKTAEVWEKLIARTIYTINDEEGLKYFEYFKEKNLIERCDDEDIIYLKMPYVIARMIDDEYYLVNTMFNTVIRTSEKIYLAIINDDLSKLNEQAINELLKQNIITKNDWQKTFRIFVEDTYYSVYIILTYLCNMACVYCFEGNGKNSKKMDDLTLEQIYRYIDTLATQKKVEIIFYGGEPLLECNKKRIMEIMGKYKNKQNIYYRFITNGLNIPLYMDVFELYKNKITRFVITIDGVREIHNKKRIRHDKEGTYDSIIRSIKLLTENDYHVTIRINIDKETIDSQIDSVMELSNQILKRDNVDISIHIIHFRYSEDYIEPSILDCYHLQQRLREISEIPVIFSHPLLSFCSNTLDKVWGYPHIYDGQCMYNNSRVIDINGDIYKCSEAMKEKELCIGNVKEIDMLENDQGYIDCKKNGECRRCDHYLICYGKCSYQNFIDNKKKGCVCDMGRIDEALDEFLRKVKAEGFI